MDLYRQIDNGTNEEILGMNDALDIELPGA